MIGPSTQDLAQAATDAAAMLTAKADAYNVRRLRRYIMQELPRGLGVIPDKVSITMSAASDVIGIAAIVKNGDPVAVSGSKVECLANPKEWVAARCVEILEQFGVT